MRTILADTQVALWLLLDDPALPERYRALAGESGIRWLFHQVSLWEVQIKYDLGKLPLSEAPERLLPPALKAAGFQRASMEDEGIFMLARLPPLHRDPFDRLLIAHALVHGWELATTDEQVRRYPVRVV